MSAIKNVLIAVVCSREGPGLTRLASIVRVSRSRQRKKSPHRHVARDHGRRLARCERRSVISSASRHPSPSRASRDSSRGRATSALHARQGRARSPKPAHQSPSPHVLGRRDRRPGRTCEQEVRVSVDDSGEESHPERSGECSTAFGGPTRRARPAVRASDSRSLADLWRPRDGRIWAENRPGGGHGSLSPSLPPSAAERRRSTTAAKR